VIARAVILASAIVLLGCGGAGGSTDSSSSALRAIGYGPGDSCHLLPSTTVDELAVAGLRFLVCENIPSVQARDWRRGEIPQTFPVEHREWNQRACANGQTMIVFLLNWNMRPLRDQPDEWFVELLNEALSIYDPVCTWLEPIAEPDEGTPEQLERARRWTQMAADAWLGRLVIAHAAERWPIRRDFVDRHPATIREAELWLASGDPRLLVITDGGEFVPIGDVVDELPRLAALSLESGVPFIGYGDRYAPGDLEAHREIIRAIGGRVP